MTAPRRILLLFFCVVALASFASVASALSPAFTASYWWMLDRGEPGHINTIRTDLGADAPDGVPIIRIDQADFYLKKDDHPFTLFGWNVVNINYRPGDGFNGLSGFELPDISPFHYHYLSDPGLTPPHDPVTGNDWISIGPAPLNEFNPDWEATWGLDPLNPDTEGLYGPGDPNAPSGALHSGIFSILVNGWVPIGDVDASIHTWDKEFGVPDKFLDGRASGPVPIPEPGTLLLLGLGMTAAALKRRLG